jgi:hypothetical protein
MYHSLAVDSDDDGWHYDCASRDFAFYVPPIIPAPLS